MIISHRLKAIVLGTAILGIAVFTNISCSKDSNPVYYPTQETLYDNGTFITHHGTGYNGADASALHDGLVVLGFSCDTLTGYKIADDFTITDPNGWNIKEMTFYIYQTGSDTISTITDLRVQIWNGHPDSAASTVIWGTPDSNVLKTSVWSHCYRTSSTDTATAHTRPIMATTCDINDTLPAGTYWVEFSTEGSLASGPWAVPLDTLGVTVTGNAAQFNNTIWQNLLDSGTATAQGVPFLVKGYRL